MNAHQRTIFRFLGSGFCAFGLALALYGCLKAVSPTVPDPVSGRIYPMNDHGYLFFVTADQRIGFFALLALFCLLVLIATFLSIRWKELQSPKAYVELFKHLTNR